MVSEAATFGGGSEAIPLVDLGFNINIFARLSVLGYTEACIRTAWGALEELAGKALLGRSPRSGQYTWRKT